MATITEQDIINYLKEKIEFHQSEIVRLETIFSAFNVETATPPVKKDKFTALESSFTLPEKIGPGRKTKALKIKTAKRPKPLHIPASYADNLTVNGKIAFALKQIGSGFNEDIAEEIAKYEPQSDTKKISKQISGILSTLKSKGHLRAEKSGRKDKFSLA